MDDPIAIAIDVAELCAGDSDAFPDGAADALRSLVSLAAPLLRYAEEAVDRALTEDEVARLARALPRTSLDELVHLCIAGGILGSSATEEETQRCRVYVARFRSAKGRWVIVEGDPTDRHWTNGVGAQKLLRGDRLHEMLRSFTGEEIVELKLRELEFFDCLGQPLRGPSFAVRA